MYKEVKEIFINDTLNYNLSYDFFYNNIGIDVQECYPLRCGFHMVDKNKNNYIFIKILHSDLSKYIAIFDILEYLKKNNDNISEMYSVNGRKYFFDDVNEDYYIIFKLKSGVYKKWVDFNIDCTINSLKNFYHASLNILNNFRDNIEISTIGNELRMVNKNFLVVENIEKIISHKQNHNIIDKFFHDNKKYMEEELFEANEFFSSREYKNYCENQNNIRFIHGNLSNKSFLFDEDNCSIVNFYNSSIDLFVKDISIFIKNGMTHVSNLELGLFVRNILKIFNYDDKFNFKIIANYLKTYNYIFKILNEHYIENNFVEDKICEIDYYKQKQNDFIKNYLL